MHEAGVSPLESWDWTWGEGTEAVKAYQDREHRRGKRQAVALYNAAAFLLSGVGGKVLSFSEAFPGYQEEQKTMSDEAMYQQARAFNAMFGGREE